MPKLENPKHEAFAHEYALTLNATESYKKAGYNCKTEHAFNTAASRLLCSVEVSQRIAELINERMNTVKDRTTEFIEQLQHMSLFDPGNIFEYDGVELCMKAFEDIDVKDRRMIQDIDLIKAYDDGGNVIGTTLKLKFVPKKSMMDMWARHKSLFNDKLNVQHETVEQYIKRIKESK